MCKIVKPCVNNGINSLPFPQLVSWLNPDFWTTIHRHGSVVSSRPRRRVWPVRNRWSCGWGAPRFLHPGGFPWFLPGWKMDGWMEQMDKNGGSFWISGGVWISQPQILTYTPENSDLATEKGVVEDEFSLQNGIFFRYELLVSGRV